MSDLIIMVCGDMENAEKVRTHLYQVKDEKGFDLDESVVVVVSQDNRVHFHHSQHFTFPAALSGGFLGFLAGMLLVHPVFAFFGGIIGGMAGAVIGAMKEIGLDEDFMERLAKELKPGTSALFLVPHGENILKILLELKKFEGEIISTPLAHKDDEKLKRILKDIYGHRNKSSEQ